MLGRVTGASIAACVLIGVLSSGVAFGAQGSSVAASSVSPTKWWGTVCSDLVSYTRDTAKYEKALVATLQNPKSPGDVKAKLITFLNSNLNRANSLIATLKRAGTPNAPGGAQFASGLQSGFVQLRDGFKRVIPEARAAPTGSTAALQSAVNAIHGELTTLATQSANTEDAARQLSSPQLTAARQGQKACSSLNQ
jgi:hypothetical protein